MKKFLLFVTVIGLFTACNTEEMEKRIADLEKTNQALEQKSAEKDSVLKAFDETFTSITRNLAMIRQSEESIRLESQDVELSGDQREAIEREIQDINTLLESNKEQIKSLSGTISKYKGEVGNYKNMLAGLEKEINAKDEEISELKKNLVAANFTIDILNKMNEELANEIRSKQSQLETMTDESHTAYYVVGTFKELKEKGIAERAGILAGKKMQDGFNKEDFVSIDTRTLTAIQISSTSAEVISNHPADSYHFVGDSAEDYRLEILSPKEFWKASNYLVIQIK